jgi:hypothetical protein
MLSPAVFCFGFDAAISNNLPRYNVLLIPLLWVATAIFLHHGIGAVMRRRRRWSRWKTAPEALAEE